MCNEEMDSMRARIAELTLTVAELAARVQEQDHEIETLNDSVNIVSDFAIVHQKHHEAVVKMTRGEQIIELMQAGYLMDDIQRRDRHKQVANRGWKVLNTAVEEER